MSEQDLKINREDAQFLAGGAVNLISCFLLLAQALGLLTPHMFKVLSPADEAHPALVPSATICAAFLILHNIRVWFGLTFLENDKSFLEAVQAEEARDPDGIKSRHRRHRNIWIMLYGSTLAGSVAGGQLGFWGFAIVLSVQSVGLVMSDVNWWKILISGDSDDRERAANKFIFVGDVAVCLFSATLLVVAALRSGGVSISSHAISAIFLFFFGALLAVFIGEFWSQYRTALLARWKSITRS